MDKMQAFIITLIILGACFWASKKRVERQQEEKENKDKKD